MNPLVVAAIGAPATAAASAYVTYRLGMRRSQVDVREVGVEERRAAVAEMELALTQGAAMRDELRDGQTALAGQNAAQATQIAGLTADNGVLHTRIHDLANRFAAVQLTVMDLTTTQAALTEDRDQCRRDLSDVLFAVNALEQGRDRMTKRLDQLEGDN